MKIYKHIRIPLALVLMLASLTSCNLFHEHTWRDATCTEPFRCEGCEETSGEALGHSWLAQTCTEPQQCSSCGAQQGEANGHAWVEATCEQAKTCETCGLTEGTVMGHTWKAANCVNPETCTRCGATRGEARGCTIREATCTKPSMCTVCNRTYQPSLGHDWTKATCTQASKCTRCNLTQGSVLPHAYLGPLVCGQQRTCIRCGKAEAMVKHSYNQNGVCTRCQGLITAAELQASVQFHVDIVSGRWTDTLEPVEFLIITCVNRSSVTLNQVDYELSVPTDHWEYHWADITITPDSVNRIYDEFYTSGLNRPLDKVARLDPVYKQKGDHLQTFEIGTEVPRNVYIWETIRVGDQTFTVHLTPGQPAKWY